MRRTVWHAGRFCPAFDTRGLAGQTVSSRGPRGREVYAAGRARARRAVDFAGRGAGDRGTAVAGDMAYWVVTK